MRLSYNFVPEYAMKSRGEMEVQRRSLLAVSLEGRSKV